MTRELCDLFGLARGIKGCLFTSPLARSPRPRRMYGFGWALMRAVCVSLRSLPLPSTVADFYVEPCIGPTHVFSFSSEPWAIAVAHGG